MQLLEDSLNGKDIPSPRCETDQIDKNIALGRSIYIKSTPTFVMGDGRVIPGFKDAKRIIELVDELSQEKKEVSFRDQGPVPGVHRMSSG